MREKMILLFGILTATVLPFSADANPTITSASGTLEDGGSLIIEGSGFGTHPLKIEWLGGPNGNIEQGGNGTAFSKSGWWADPTNGAWGQAPLYSTARAHSGTKSIKQSWPVGSNYDSGFGYDTGGPIGTLYMSWWIYFKHAGSQGQYKMFRIEDTNDVMDSDGTFYYNQWYDTGGGNYQAANYLFCSLNYDQCYPGSNPALRYPADMLRPNQWVRIEVYGKESSGSGVRDGSLSFLQHTQSGSAIQMLSGGPWNGTIITRASGVSARWRFIQFEGYWGNIGDGTGTGEEAYIDDIYIQVGTQARVEIGDNLSWASCTHREIQAPVSWSDGSITFIANKGSFANGTTVYLYVVDSNGNVNAQGYQVIIGSSGGGGGGGDTISPSPPTGVRIEN